MKKKLTLIFIILVLLISINIVFASNSLIGSFIKILNSPPEATMGSPTDNQVIITNKPLIRWSYNDKENDPQRQFLIQYDTNRFFEAGVIEAGIGSQEQYIITIREGDGPYFVRIKVKDDYGWGPWSNFRTFYLDTTAKICSDSTPYYACSQSQPAYCDGGVLINDCYECGCPSSSSCSKEGLCQKLTCADETLYGECSSNQPKLCNQGVLVDFASKCGCPNGKEPQIDGTCKTSKIIEPEPQITEEPEPPQEQQISTFKRIISFIKKIFTITE